MEALVVTGVLALLASVSLVLLSNVQESVSDQKLRKDVSSLNSAVKVYLTNGGDLHGVVDPKVVLAKLKTVAAASTSKRIVGLKGSALDVRTVMEEQTAAEAASNDLRAYWDKNNQRFYLETTGSKGIARFRIDENSAVSGGSESRETNLQYAKEGRWVWDYQDRTSGGGNAPSDIPGGPGTPPGIPPTNAATSKPLLAPSIDVPGQVYDFDDYPMVVSITDPNTAVATGVSELMYSVDSTVWVLYTGPVSIEPGDKLEAIAVSIDPDNWSDSPVDKETYTIGVVTPELEVTLPGAVNYFELGGEVMMPPGTTPWGAYPPVSPGTVKLLNADDIPDAYESSAFFQVYWTTDDSDPLASPTRESGESFSNGYVTQEVPLRLDSWPAGALAMPVKVAAQAHDRDIFEDSPVYGTTVAGEVLALRAPTISIERSNIEISFVTSYGDMPAGARIYYTTDGSGPDIASGTLYTGPFNLDDDAQITARVVGPEGDTHWFTPSPDVSREFVSPFTREVFIGGRFAMPDGSWRNVAKLDEAGAVDPGFDPGLGASYGSTVGALLPQGGGRILAGGDFDTMNNQLRRALARLLPDGSVDTSFDAGIE